MISDRAAEWSPKLLPPCERPERHISNRSGARQDNSNKNNRLYWHNMGVVLLYN